MSLNKQRLMQVLTEDLYSKKNIRKYISNYIRNSNAASLNIAIKKSVVAIKKFMELDNPEINLIRHLEPEDIIYEILVITSISQGFQPIQSVCAKMEYLLQIEDSFLSANMAGELLGVVCNSNLIDITKYVDNSEESHLVVKPIYTLSKKLVTYIEKTKYLPPMVCKPEKVVNNFMTGYITVKEHIILGKGNRHEETQGLYAINIASKVALSLDPEVLKLKETSNKPLDTIDKRKAHELMINSSREVYNDILKSGNKFYFCYKFDMRGRMYSLGYHINIQSTEYKKALINLATPQLIEG